MPSHVIEDMTKDSVNTSNKYFCTKCRDQNYLIECKCGRCDKIIFKRDNHRRIREYAHNHHHFGENHPKWNNGITYSRNYRYILMPDYPRAEKDGYVAEHIYVYQEYNKVCILPWAEIHHIDPVREGYCNNMPWNLIGVMKAAHRTLDRTKNLDGNICINCNSSKTYNKKNDRPMWYYDKNDNPLCDKCYKKSKWVKKDRKKKDWTVTTCCLCGSNKTVMNHRGNYDWRSYQNKGVVCNKCYKKEYRKNKKIVG
jgi:hypothetical protein